VRARQGEPCAALPTEPRPLRIRSLAPWTPHGGDKSPKKLRMLVNPKNTPSVAEGTAVQEAAAGHNKCQHPKEAAPVSRSFDDHVSPSSLLVLSTTFVDLDVSIIEASLQLINHRRQFVSAAINHFASHIENNCEANIGDPAVLLE